VSKGALIVGGTVAGVQAALDLANSGICVHLVESSPFLGRGAQVHVPRHLLNARLLEVSKHQHITVWTGTSISRAAGQAGHFRVELRQHPRYVDLTKCTACKDCLEVCPVTVPGTDRRAIYLAEDGQPGCAVIDKLGKAPCSNTCPGGIHVQGYVALIAQGRFGEALDLIRRAIPFPGICGRICTHPCELNCRRAEVDEAVSIRLLKRFVADWALSHPDRFAPDRVPEPDPEAKRVAVIGAGPAGMAVANDLVRRGHRVTVFEALPVVGGMMAVGIPPYRLPREVIQQEIERIERLGVEIHLNSPIGPDGVHTLDELQQIGYDAIFVGVGAHRSHHLRISGEELCGVVSGIELLRAINLAHQSGDPHWESDAQSHIVGGPNARVAVIGGGNTAMDVARSLKRLGVEDVRILYRRTRAEMPALPEEIEEAEHEGIPIDFLVSPVRILGSEQGSVSALECVRMKLGEPDHSGRRRPVPIAGSEFVLDLDMVIQAIGQAPDLSFLGKGHSFAITREGTFNIDRVSYMTNRPGVFAAGDAITQPVSVIDAIGSAKQAAAGIDSYLRGLAPEELQVSAREVPIARRELLPEDLSPMPRHASPAIPMAQRTSSYTEVELGYDAETAIAEAQRCLMCGPCSECLACELVCEPKAILHDQLERFEELDVGAIIWADEVGEAGGIVPGLSSLSRDGSAQSGVYCVEPDDPFAGSVSAARVMMALASEQRRTTEPAPAIVGLDGAARVGVFICGCNGQISEIVDTATVQSAAETWPGVAYAVTLPQACSEEGADGIYRSVADQNLNRVVLAACSCCATDQVCHSCTFQRVRCKDNLLGRRFDRGSPLFEFVNIREQCAWIHEEDPAAATAAASAMTAAAVAKARLSTARLRQPQPLDKIVLILGTAQSAAICQEALSAQGIQALRLQSAPRQIRQTSDHFTAVMDNGPQWNGSAIILAPRDELEYSRVRAAFDMASRQPRPQSQAGPAGTHRPGIFWCDPAVDPAHSGMAAAARAAAWLGYERPWPEPATYQVDPQRCRGCGDCEQICEFGAIQLQGEGQVRVAWIDPLICQGDGTCAVRCPAGAIKTERLTGMQMEAMLEALLA
jgi:NADPH-dependent glutamate synthase beta subunit-like oxidoreductase/NAD-dependent dihydropyrimidine dehydrogenase PreA subunit